MEKNTSPSAFTAATHGEVLKFLWQYMKKQKVLFGSAVLLSMSGAVVGLVQPFYYSNAVDLIASHAAGDTSAFRQAIGNVAIGVLLGFVVVSCEQISYILVAKLEVRTMRSAWLDLYGKTLQLSTNFHVNAFAGATSRKIGRGINAIESIVDNLFINFLPLLAIILGFMAILGYIAPMMGVVIVASMALYIPIAIWLNMKSAALTSYADEQDTKSMANQVDTITGNATVKSFGTEMTEVLRHKRLVEEWSRRQWKSWLFGNISGWIQVLLMMLIELLLLSLAVWLWYIGNFTPGGFVIAMFYIGRLWGYMRDIGRQVRNYLQGVAHAEEMVGLWQVPLGVSDRPAAPTLSVKNGAIEFNAVTFRYETATKPVFSNFSMSIKPGEKIALVGHSGGGKSTFVKLLQRLYDIQEGAITIDGQDIRSVTQESLRKAIGLVPQDPILFHRSLTENIAYGKPEATMEEIIDAAKKAHAHEFIEALPKGYNTLVGERGVKLSGGERQRVAIARAILADTPILILDEATSSLDSLSEKYIQDALQFLMKGKTTIVIAHRLSTIKQVDRILVIEEGSIVEEGKHSELIAKDHGIYREFYELQAGGFIGE